MKSILLSFLVLISFGIFAQNGGETCANATVIPSIPYQATGTTIGAADDYFASCQDVGNPGGAVDVVYEFTNGATAVYIDISVCQAITNYDSQIYIYENSCTGNPVGCQEDGCQSPAYSAAYNSTITAQYLNPNTTYYIVVDGYNGGSEGDFQLNITESIGLTPPTESNLPLVVITTNGQTIPDEPKVNVHMKIMDFSPFLNHPTDPGNFYDGHAGIEIRGSYSASLPQKPYGIETRDSLGFNNNVSILNMPSENDWILLPNYNDKTFLRNIVAFDLFEKMGHYAPRTQLCEVILDDIYQGIYVFTEKIKRDKDRVDIRVTDSLDISGDSLTGGYIFKVDYWNWSDSWLSTYDNPNYPGNDVHFVYDYPDALDITPEQVNYLQGTVGAFEDALWGPNFTDPTVGYRAHIDVLSFIDYFIVNEFARNIDGFKKSRRFHKNSDNVDSLIYAGPVWDFDWAYKNTSNSELNGVGWRHSFSGGTDVTPPGWYIRLIQDPEFADQLACRYFNLRQTILKKDNLFQFIDSLGSYVDLAQVRHYERWPILGQNVGTPEVGTQPTTYAGELTKFKDWISERLDWLDLNMPGNCPNVGIEETEAKVPYFVAYPNPTNGEINFYADQAIEYMEITDLAGKSLGMVLGNSQQLITLDRDLPPGTYIATVFLESGRTVQTRFTHL
ncbi:MAG: CotH kinase family protein [Crocinitomicaceae bacterium]|nr:CotH kinase family protein [Flavobacteriales bacterium]NQZ36150.1 CotH kinase family protein [Crocinitomicaceae bacterium]